MADNSVYIAGVADGAFENALGDLPPWASEDTALSIETILRKSLGIQTKMLSEAVKSVKSAGSGSLSPDDIKQVNNELDKFHRQLKRQIEDGARDKKLRKDLEKDDKENLTRGRKLNTGSEKLTYVLTGLATAGTKVAGVYSDYIDVYDSMYKSGINLLAGQDGITDGFESLNHLVNETGLRLATLQKVAEKYATTVNVVGMIKFGKAVANASTQMQTLGYSQEASAEFIANMMEAEQGYSSIRGMSAERMSQDAIKLAGQMDRLGKTVGMSREQLAENLKNSGKTANMAMVSAKLGSEAAARANANMAGLDPKIREVMTKMLAYGNPAQVSEYATIVSAGSADVASAFENIAKLATTMDDPASFMKSIQAFGKMVEAQTGTMGNLGNFGDAGQDAANMLYAFTQQGKVVSDASKTQLDNAQKTQASVARLQTETQRSMALLEAAFFPLTEQVNLAAKSLKMLNDVAYAGIKTIDAEIRSWIGVGIAVVGFISGLVLARGALTTFASLFGIQATAATTATSTLGGSIMSVLKPLAILAAAFVAMTAIVAGVDAIFGQFGVGGKPIDSKQDDTNWDRMSVLQKAESSLARGVEKIGSALFMGNLANEAAADRIKAETEYFRKKDGTSKENQSDAETSRLARKSAEVTIAKPTTISVPTTPMASTIDSPSSVDVQPPKVPEASETVPSSSTIATATIPKPASNADINSLLSFQSNLLEQILLSSNSLISVNKDILKAARNH